jgi:hypothetical protein
MELSYNTAPSLIPVLLHKLRAERPFLRTLPQPQQPNEDVLLWIFVRQEGLPPAVGSIVPPQELDGLRADFVVDFVDLKWRRIRGYLY